MKEGSRGNEQLRDDSVWRNHLHVVNGSWYARNSPETRGVRVSTRMAAIIRVALTQNEKMNPRILLGETTDPKERMYLAYNCHRLAHDLRGPPADDLEKVSVYTARVESEIATLTGDRQNFYNLGDELVNALRKCDLPIVVHVAKDYDNKPIHSFTVLGFDETGDCVCFDKHGVHFLPFHVRSLSRIMHTYSRHNNCAVIVPESTEQLRAQRNA